MLQKENVFYFIPFFYFEFYFLTCYIQLSPDIVQVTKSRRMRWAGQ